MASGPITSWHVDEEKVEAVTDFIFLGSKIIACSYEMKRLLLLGRKAMTNRRHIQKRRQHQRTDASELWCWKRLLRVPWTPRSSNQSILKEINPENSLEGLMLKLKLQYFGHLMRRASVQFSSVAQLCLTLRLHGLQHARFSCPPPAPGAYSNSVHRVSDAIQSSHPLSSPSPPSFNLSQHQGLFR